MGDKYDPSKPEIYIANFDVNNLYGFIMQQFLPIGGFQFDKNIDKYTEEFIQNIPDSGDYGCFIECSLSYPEHLHPEHNNFPLCPETVAVTKSMLSDYQQQLAKVMFL